MKYEVNMKFRKPPMFSVTVEAESSWQAREMARQSAVAYGFGTPKVYTVVAQK